MSLQNTMRALSDPIRREILELLKSGRLSAGQIAEKFPVSGAAVSKHLSVLKEAELIRDTRDGKFIYPITEVIYSPTEPLTAGGCHITPALLESKSPLLPDFYRRVIDGLKTTIEGLSRTGGEKYEHFCSILQELTELEDTVYGNR